MSTNAANRKWRSEPGFLLSVELIVLLLAVMASSLLVVGVVSTSILDEVADLGSAVGRLNTSFTLTGTTVDPLGEPQDAAALAEGSGSIFADSADYCDQGATCGVRRCIAPPGEAPRR